MNETLRAMMPLPVRLRCLGRSLPGLYSLPENPSAIIFVLGCESWPETRLREISESMNGLGYACLCLDLLDTEEMRAGNPGEFHSSQIDRFSDLVFAAIEKWMHLPELAVLKGGLLVSGMMSGASLVAGARMPDIVKAACLFDGRPDFAGQCLDLVRFPVMLLTDPRHPELRAPNAIAARQLRSARFSVLEIHEESGDGNGGHGDGDAHGPFKGMLRNAEFWFHRHLQE